MSDTAEREKWNILVITSDEHNAKIMGCANHPIIRTPGLDRLASEGTLFSKAYCAYPICAPTRQSFITGQYPMEHGQLSNAHVFDKRNQTWAHHFKEHGYTTASIGKMHTNHESYDYGYDYRYSTEDISEEIKAQRAANPPQFDPDDKLIFDSMTDKRSGEKQSSRLHGKVVNDESLETDAIMLKEAVQYLKAHQSDKFFLHVSFVQPHWYWNTPKEYYYMYDPAKIDLPESVPSELERNAVVYKMAEQAGWFQNTEKMNRLARARYYSSISWMDHNVNQLLNTLDELELTENTLVVYFSDHGDMAGEKGLWLKNQMYDSSARIPLIIRMPGIVPAGEVNDKLINHVDLFPTLAGLTGTQDHLSNHISGDDLSSYVTYSDNKNEDQTGKQFTFSVQGLKSVDSIPMQVMARSARWKFIQYNLEEPEQRYVLYDMNNDPDETENLAYEVSLQSVVQDHIKAIDEFLYRLRKPRYEVKLKKDAFLQSGH
ncbi:Choline-sulfatase [Paenibacillus allorhizoplanae]|uniref:Choline-sulfatase n=1 Tax=Paenibacillus allorhizoplanae TaxID=2905648 RepID=A0ABM9CMA9_9BACL|nr:sulfatase-like hydrolase/transferase [Paenibacillus allorhizoplanae]CAH1217020.1 Choline-sulfatase [Paenibacillus allorhizoplanae]